MLPPYWSAMSDASWKPPQQPAGLLSQSWGPVAHLPRCFHTAMSIGCIKSPIEPSNTQLIYPLALDRVARQSGLVNRSLDVVGRAFLGYSRRRISNARQQAMNTPRQRRFSPFSFSQRSRILHLLRGCCKVLQRPAMRVWKKGAQLVPALHSLRSPLHCGPPSMPLPGLANDAQVGEPTHGHLSRQDVVRPTRPAKVYMRFLLT